MASARTKWIDVDLDGLRKLLERHAEDAQLNFAQVECDFAVEATTRGLVLQGVAE